MVQIEVRVRDKETGIERDITYKSYKDLISRYELIGQIDEAGNLIDGSPNLLPQHQTQTAKKDVAHADDGAVTVTISDATITEEPEIVNSLNITVPHETVKEHKKRGPKPKINNA